jgi:hypothetical protein
MSELSPSSSLDPTLLPCLFCGSTSLSITVHSLQPEDWHNAHVECRGCDATGPHSISVEGCWMGREEARAAAAAAWNRIPRSPAFSAAIQEPAQEALQDPVHSPASAPEQDHAPAGHAPPEAVWALIDDYARKLHAVDYWSGRVTDQRLLLPAYAARDQLGVLLAHVPATARELAEAQQRVRMAERAAARPGAPASPDFDLPAAGNEPSGG